MKTKLYLTGFEVETAEDKIFYKLRFFDTINGLIFVTYIESNSLKENYIELINNGYNEIINKLKKELEINEKR